MSAVATESVIAAVVASVNETACPPPGRAHVPLAARNFPAADDPAGGAGTTPDTPPDPVSPTNSGMLTLPVSVMVLGLQINGTTQVMDVGDDGPGPPPIPITTASVKS